jgi:hypothetical protein
MENLTTEQLQQLKAAAFYDAENTFSTPDMIQLNNPHIILRLIAEIEAARGIKIPNPTAPNPDTALLEGLAKTAFLGAYPPSRRHPRHRCRLRKPDVQFNQIIYQVRMNIR